VDLDADVVRITWAAFKSKELAILKSMTAADPQKADAEESLIAKLAGEMKSLPSRVAERLAETEGPLVVRLDRDLLLWLRQQKGYQTTINAVLRAYMEANCGAAKRT
jgi:uncharacterized protein (DUF4415 family)